MLKNAPTLAIRGVDTAESGPSEIWTSLAILFKFQNPEV